MGSDEDDRLRRKLTWRCGHRGTRELDMMLSAFAAEHLPAMTRTDLLAFEQFTELPEPLLHAILTKDAPVPETVSAPLAALLNTYSFQARVE